MVSAKLGGELAHGDRVRAALGEQSFRGLAQALTEIGDVGLGQDAGHVTSSHKTLAKG
jgi:hypothetical protein